VNSLERVRKKCHNRVHNKMICWSSIRACLFCWTKQTRIGTGKIFTCTKWTQMLEIKRLNVYMSIKIIMLKTTRCWFSLWLNFATVHVLELTVDAPYSRQNWSPSSATQRVFNSLLLPNWYNIHRVKLEVYFAFAFPGTAMSLVVASAPDAVAPRLAWLLPPSTTSSPCVGRTPQRGLP